MFDYFVHMMPDSTMGYVNMGAIVVAASSAFAAVISKLTKNTTDDKIANWLKKLHDLLAMGGLHGASLDAKRAGAAVSAKTLSNDVREHRKSKLKK